jgi:hypothetical protein
MRELTAVLAALIVIFMVLILLGLPVAYVVGTYRRAAQIFAEWAATNGYRIIESERMFVRKGPFFYTSSNSQIIYHVTVQDAQGNIRRGWVRCGSFWFGPWQNVVDVRWDE